MGEGHSISEMPVWIGRDANVWIDLDQSIISEDM